MIMDMSVRKILPEYTSKQVYVVSYYKVGHSATRGFTTPLETVTAPTSDLLELIQQGDAQEIIYVVRHPADRLLSGIKQLTLNQSGFKMFSDNPEDTWQSKYISQADTVSILHDRLFWQQSLDIDNDIFSNLTSDPHTKNYLATVEQLYRTSESAGISQHIVDIRHMNYYFAQQNMRCYQINPSPFSHMINSVIVNILTEMPLLTELLQNHIKQELEIYNSLTDTEAYPEPDELDQAWDFKQLLRS